MLIVESTKYMVPILRVGLRLRSGIIGWWNELENKFVLGSKDNLNYLIKLTTTSYNPNTYVIIYAEKYHGKYYARMYINLKKIQLIETYNKGKILYRRNPKC